MNTSTFEITRIGLRSVILILNLQHADMLAIGKSAFVGCNALSGEVILPHNLTSLGEGAFSRCGFTGTLVIPDSVTTIGDSAFYYSKFTSVTLSDHLTNDLCHKHDFG